MSDSLSRSGGTENATSAKSITYRVLARLSEADLTNDPNPPVHRRRRTRRRRDHPGRTPEQTREAQSLRRVFLEMGHAYREYRARTGALVSADVKAAADHFRQDPNVSSLVSVAARLDELRVLTW